ncbi:hypothetical protein niasHT_021888 [Heterodera trifolii]|uniref:Uncharacterized protein n=1 Tax=Heterodera trifolii TaxID=157864 RepID=A0ABD2JC74_9BILA
MLASKSRRPAIFWRLMCSCNLKTRRWTLGFIEIRLNDQNGQMEIVNRHSILLLMHEFALPRGVCGFEGIKMNFFNKNVQAFLNLCRNFFQSGYKIHLDGTTKTT